MNEPTLKAAAVFLAEHTPKHLGQPTTPPIHWELEGDILRVLMADGREVRAPLADLKPKPAPRAPAKVTPPSYSRSGAKVQEPIQVQTPAKPPAGHKP